MLLPFLLCSWVAPCIPQDPPAGEPVELLQQGEPVGELPDIRVRPLRSERPATQPTTQVSRATREELLATGERTLPRMIGAATGVWVQETNLGGGSPFVRGVTGNQILILVDGVRINDSTTRFGPNQNLNTIPPSVVESVEVVRGPASVLYGSDAVGGVIAITTRTRSRWHGASGASGSEHRGSEHRGAELDIDYISQLEGGRATASASASGAGLGGLPAGVFASVSVNHFEDLESGSGTVPNTGYDGGDVFLSSDLQLDPGSWLRYSYRLHRDADVPRTDALNPGFPTSIGGPFTGPSDERRLFARQQYQAHLLSYTDEREGGFADRFQARLSYREVDERRERIRTGDDELRLERDDVSTLGLGLDWRDEVGGGHELTYGFDADFDRVDSTRFDVQLDGSPTEPANGSFAPGSEYLRLGVFVQDEFQLAEAVDVTAGLRWSRFDFEFDAFDPAIGSLPDDGGADNGFDDLTASLALAGDLARGVRLSGTLAQGFRAPNLDELAAVGSFGGGVELPNPNLSPEETLYGELALDVFRPAWQSGLAVYHNSISDVVGRQFDADASAAFGEDTFRRENQGTVTIYGIEAYWRGRLGSETSRFNFEVSGAFQRGRQYDDTMDPTTGEALFNDVPYRRIPPLFGQAVLEYAPRVGELDWLTNARVDVRCADEQDELSPGDISDRRIDPNGSAGWAVVGLAFEGPLGRGASRFGNWRVRFENLGDASYRVHGSGFDGPGFGVSLGFTLGF